MALQTTEGVAVGSCEHVGVVTYQDHSYTSHVQTHACIHPELLNMCKQLRSQFSIVLTN